ncbi:hypothetical protein Tco_0876573 [Tanacetum coccineum]|uniref:Reverse transcriptase domain-containing protein n=1 Tax=Tanacetum coccineum TaxID=301880 RepID=A0ABQ5BVL8_9ASTR
MEFSYNAHCYAYSQSFKCAPFEALYGRKCRSPVIWTEVGESQLIGPKIVQEMTEKIIQIKERLQNCQGSQPEKAMMIRGASLLNYKVETSGPRHPIVTIPLLPDFGGVTKDISPTILEAAKTLSKVASQGVSKVSTGSTKVDSGTASKRGQREGKAPMVEEDIQATHKTKEQIRQEEARLEEAIKLQAQMDEEVAKQIHLDEMVAKRMAEEEALSEQQKKRKAQVQFEAQYYTEEDWDAIRAKLEANAELTKDVLGKDLPEQDFAKRMVDMIKESLIVVQQIDTFVMDFEATKAKLKRYGEELQTKTSKKQKIDDKDVPAIGEKVD